MKNVNSFKIPQGEMELVESFIIWSVRYKTNLIQAVLDPDMDDEIILITCEGELNESYSAMSQEARFAVNDFMFSIFRDMKLSRLEEFIYNLLKIEGFFCNNYKQK